MSQVWMEYRGIMVRCRMGDVGLKLGKEIRVRKRLEVICIELLVSGSYKIEPGTTWARGEWPGNFAKERSFRKACIYGDDWRRTGDKCRGRIVRDRREWGACVLETTGEGFKEHPMAPDVIRWWMMWNAKKPKPNQNKTKPPKPNNKNMKTKNILQMGEVVLLVRWTEGGEERGREGKREGQRE